MRNPSARRRLQPLDARDVGSVVAALAAFGALRLQDAVALLPLPQRVGWNARALGRAAMFSPSDTLPPDRCQVWTTLSGYAAIACPKATALHRAARRLQPLVGERLRVESPHPRAAVKGVAER